ncbi:MAG TPA: 4-(cytidine 5'-diphospho)-2-C-methyl-D-erythritol kinase [Bryobacteraceae bacterium]|nr:4-(cytidine 5'-diphospho)-2-C-methyl-D-erythritol kinase [Bryobacteraceae bacterium]
MTSGRRVTDAGRTLHVEVPAFAKLNLDLRVLHKRPDGYHEIRTIFQTISLRETLGIEFRRARRTELILDSSIDIEDNIVLRAARAVLDRLGMTAWVRLFLRKRIPMGAGLGGGSSDAAAVLRALPVLAGKSVPQGQLHEIAAALGSDVPFFLYGGTALGLGRGTELYPLPDIGALPALVVASGVHVSTSDAYRSLERGVHTRPRSNITDSLTSHDVLPILGEFQAIAWGLHRAALGRLHLKNDFEKAVFSVHPELASLSKKLKRLGAKPALMTGSGSALFGIFASVAEAKTAAGRFPAGWAYPVRFLPRAGYCAAWRRALGDAAQASFPA